MCLTGLLLSAVVVVVVVVFKALEMVSKELFQVNLKDSRPFYALFLHEPADAHLHNPMFQTYFLDPGPRPQLYSESEDDAVNGGHRGFGPHEPPPETTCLAQTRVQTKRSKQTGSSAEETCLVQATRVRGCGAYSAQVLTHTTHLMPAVFACTPTSGSAAASGA